MHTKINISTVFIKFVLKIQEANFLNIIGNSHTRCRRAAAKKGPARGTHLTVSWHSRFLLMRNGRVSRDLPARRDFPGQTGYPPVKDCAGLAEPNTLK